MRKVFRFLLTALALATGVMTGACEMESSIQQVKAQHEAELMAIPGVVSVGIGKNKKGESVIVVGVEKEKKETISAIPDALDNYPVEVRVLGKIVTH